MADYYCCNNMLEVVDDDAHRLLPLEILKDIGIANNADELRRIAILQELSSRLATTVLGGTKEVSSQDHRRRLYPATDSYQHHHGPPHPQVYRVDNRGRIAGGHVVSAQRGHAPSSFWNATRTMVGTGIISLPRFAPPARLRHADVAPPAKQAASKGTGVFLPRAQLAYTDTTSGARTGGGGADMKPRRRGNQQVQQQRRRQLRLHVHAQAVAVGAPAELQPRWRSDAHAASFHGCHDELGLPQEWIY